MATREQALIEALFRTITTFRLEWDVTYGELLSALHTTRKAIKEQMLTDARDQSDKAS